MKAVILAAGRGIRLRPHTDQIPKPMLKVGGDPILFHTLSILPDEVSEVFIIVGWLQDEIKNYFGKEFKGKKITYLSQNEPKGTFHALSLAKDFLDEPFLMISGDDIYSKKDISEVSKKESAVLVHKTQNPERFGICKRGHDGLLCEIIEKPKEFVGDLANIGVYKLKPTIFKEDIVWGGNGEQVLAPMIGNLAKKEKIWLTEASFWHPIGDISDLNKAQTLDLTEVS
ncbi:MAG TPA: nucleotidyltransferase family protein [Candidatus Paceibacterota bacterium]|nr:nucleotidyltransferase family protein [Candidatus Paceibacterota bacterium]